MHNVTRLAQISVCLAWSVQHHMAQFSGMAWHLAAFHNRHGIPSDAHSANYCMAFGGASRFICHIAVQPLCPAGAQKGRDSCRGPV